MTKLEETNKMIEDINELEKTNEMFKSVNGIIHESGPYNDDVM